MEYLIVKTLNLYLNTRKKLFKKMALPEDIAAPCVFLASDFADYITGEVLVVDGGYSVS